MIEPVKGHQLFIGIISKYVLRQCMDVTSVRILKSRQRHRRLRSKGDRLVIYDLDTVDRGSALLGKSIIANAFKCIEHHRCVIHNRARQTQDRKLHILGCHRSPV